MQILYPFSLKKILHHSVLSWEQAWSCWMPSRRSRRPQESASSVPTHSPLDASANIMEPSAGTAVPLQSVPTHSPPEASFNITGPSAGTVVPLQPVSYFLSLALLATFNNSILMYGFYYLGRVQRVSDSRWNWSRKGDYDRLSWTSWGVFNCIRETRNCPYLCTSSHQSPQWVLPNCWVEKQNGSGHRIWISLSSLQCWWCKPSLPFLQPAHAWFYRPAFLKTIRRVLQPNERRRRISSSL